MKYDDNQRKVLLSILDSIEHKRIDEANQRIKYAKVFKEHKFKSPIKLFAKIKRCNPENYKSKEMLKTFNEGDFLFIKDKLKVKDDIVFNDSLTKEDKIAFLKLHYPKLYENILNLKNLM